MKLNLNNLAYNIVMAFLLVFAVSTVASAEVALVSGAALLSVGCLLPAAPATPTPGLAFMAIAKEIWTADIAENVFPDNSFFNRSRDDSQNLSGRIVHVPQSGSKPNVVKNRTSLPATVSQRSDTTNDYIINEFTTDPVLVQFTEQTEASYDKRSSVLADHVLTLETSVSDDAAFSWTPTLADNIITSTGIARAAYKPFQTGQRKRITKEDFANASRVMNRMNVPQKGRCCLVDADLLLDLQAIPEFMQAQIIGQANYVDGQIARVFGFDIFVRSYAGLFGSNGVKKTTEAATAVTDNASILFWHPLFVRFAKGGASNGGIEIFAQESAPQFYGDVFSALVRAGGKFHRTDQLGVVALVEATV